MAYRIHRLTSLTPDQCAERLQSQLRAERSGNFSGTLPPLVELLDVTPETLHLRIRRRPGSPFPLVPNALRATFTALPAEQIDPSDDLAPRTLIRGYIEASPSRSFLIALPFLFIIGAVGFYWWRPFGDFFQTHYFAAIWFFPVILPMAIRLLPVSWISPLTPDPAVAPIRDFLERKLLADQVPLPDTTKRRWDRNPGDALKRLLPLFLRRS